MHNGQGQGSTESGAYDLLGGTATPSNGPTVARNATATVFIPTQDEWYKAAYYKGGGADAGYWPYATQSNDAPTSANPPGGGNAANAYGPGGYARTGSKTYDPSQNYLTDVGAYASAVSAYGTFDQTGNVSEWTQSPYLMGLFHSTRGGHWGGGGVGFSCTDTDGNTNTNEFASLGFRLAGVPEPGGCAIAVIGSIALLTQRRRVTAP